MTAKPPPPDPSLLFVYIAECAGYHKVGISRDVEHRIAQLNWNGPFDVRLVMWRRYPDEMAKYCETAAHRLLQPHHRKGEWFHADETTVRQAIYAAGLETRKHARRQRPLCPPADVNSENYRPKKPFLTIAYSRSNGPW